jgi:hypothetical protein
MKKQRPMNATDLMTQQQYADLFNTHLNPATFRAMNQQLRDANNALNMIHNNTLDHSNNFLNWGNQNLATMKNQKNQLNSIITSMAGFDGHMTGIDAQLNDLGVNLRQIGGNQLILNDNRSLEAHHMMNLLNNLNPNAQPLPISTAAPAAPTGGRGRIRRRARSSGATDVSGGSPPPVI